MQIIQPNTGKIVQVTNQAVIRKNVWGGKTVRRGGKPVITYETIEGKRFSNPLNND